MSQRERRRVRSSSVELHVQVVDGDTDIAHLGPRPGRDEAAAAVGGDGALVVTAHVKRQPAQAQATRADVRTIAQRRDVGRYVPLTEIGYTAPLLAKYVRISAATSTHSRRVGRREAYRRRTSPGARTRIPRGARGECGESGGRRVGGKQLPDKCPARYGGRLTSGSTGR